MEVNIFQNKFGVCLAISLYQGYHLIWHIFVDILVLVVHVAE